MKAIKITCLLLWSILCIRAEEQDSCVHLKEITVTGLTGSTHIKQIPSPISIINPEFLKTHQYTNIIDIIAKQPGISQITTGNGISKPIIRGLGYNRVLVVNDGIRQEGQQWGDEHGVEIDAQNVHSIEILKGPASLIYGSDAMAGVLIFHDEPILSPEGMRANIFSEYQTNNGLFNYSVNFEGNKKGFVYNWRYSDKMAHDYKNRYDGYVPNSRFRERALSGMLGLNKDWGYSRLKLSYYHLTPGIIEGERNNETGELESSSGGKHYGKQLPFQQVRHYKAVLDNSFSLKSGILKVIAAYQQNRRQEYEESKNECGLDFMLHTINYDVRYILPEYNGWKTNAGINGMYQKSLNKGEEYLIPAYDLFDLGTFITVSKSMFQRLHLTGGLRFDIRHLHSHSLMDGEKERFIAFSRTFNGLTGSIGGIYNVSEKLDIRFNASRGYRAPNLSELGSNGEHEGTLRYEIGNKRLKPEYSWQFDAGIDYSFERMSFQLSLFANRIDNYIFIQKLGNIQIEDVPAYRYTAGNARIMGGEARIIIHPVRHLHFENSFSYINSVQLHSPEESRFLPFTPAPRWLSTLHYDINTNSKLLDNTYIEIEMDYNFKQNHVYRVNNSETPTPSYTLFNMSAGTNITYRKKNLFSFYIMVNNIFNKAYQNHLSRLKYADTNVITGRKGVFNMGRNIGFKILVPINL